MLQPHSFTNIGSRNKGIMWEYLTACAYRDMEVPGSKFKLTKLLSFGEHESNQHCLAIDEIKSQTQLMIKEFEAGIYTADFFQNVRTYYQQPYTKLHAAIIRTDISQATDKALLALYDLFYFAGERTYPPMLIGFFSAYLDEYFTQILTAAVSISGTELTTLKTYLLTIPQMTFIEREDIAIIHAIENIQNNPHTLEAESLSLAEGFGWFHMEYAGQPRTKTQYANLLTQRLETNVFQTDIAKEKKKAIAYQDTFFVKHPDEKLRHLVRTMHEFTFILDDSKVYTIKCHYAIYPVLEELAHRLNVTVHDLYLLSRSELHEAMIQRHIDHSLVSERAKYRALLLEGSNINLYTGMEAKQLAEQYIEILQTEVVNEVHGLVAYPGIVRGIVQLILNPKDHAKFKEGDILVTRDGSAEFTYFLQHAGAVVCDQGGIISHAAIVARESKIPTILSTRIGTKILKDGDLVEVDADKGVVRVLERV